MKTNAQAALATAVLYVTASCAPGLITQALSEPQSTRPVKIVAREVSLGKMPADSGELVGSMDGRRVAYSARREGGWAVVVDNESGKTYENVLKRTLAFSPDSKHVGYLAERAGKQFAVIDGVEGAAYEGLPANPPIFSPDGKRVATIGRRKEKSFIVLNGVEGPEYDNVYLESLVFSPDSKRVAYGAVKRGKSVVIVDGAEGKPFDPPKAVETMPDGKYVVFTSMEGDEGIFALRVFNPEMEEKGVAAFTFSVLPCILFSPDSRRVAFIARSGKEVYWVVDGVEQKRGLNGILLHNKTSALNPAKMQLATQRGGGFGITLDADRSPFSVDGNRFGYVAVKYDLARKKSVFSFVVLDGAEIASPGFCIDFHFSPDGARTGFIRNTPSMPTMVIDGRDEARESVSWESLAFSPDSKHVVYIARTGDMRYPVLDGASGKRFTGTMGFGRFLFSPDSRRTMGAFIGTDGKMFPVIDGAEGSRFDSVSPVGFTADSRHAAYFATRSGKTFLVADGQEGKPYDGILFADRAIQPPNKVCFIAVNKATLELTRVECEITEGAAAESR